MEALRDQPGEDESVTDFESSSDEDENDDFADQLLIVDVTPTKSAAEACEGDNDAEPTKQGTGPGASEKAGEHEKELRRIFESTALEVDRSRDYSGQPPHLSDCHDPELVIVDTPLSNSRYREIVDTAGNFGRLYSLILLYLLLLTPL